MKGKLKKTSYTFAIGNLMKIPIFVRITFIPLKAFTIRDDIFHCNCIL